MLMRFAEHRFTAMKASCAQSNQSSSKSEWEYRFQVADLAVAVLEGLERE